MLVRERCTPRGVGTAEHTTPDPGQRSLASVMGHLYSLLRGGRRTPRTLQGVAVRSRENSGGGAAGLGEWLVIP